MMPLSLVASITSMLDIRQIFISPGHNYFGRHGLPAAANPTLEVGRVECVAGKGLVGDRYFDHREDYKGQVTLFSADVLERLRTEFDLPQLPAAALRRNLLIAGTDLNSLIGAVFVVQGVKFEGVEECRPCYWMDQAVAPGAEAWLRGRGGLRCRVLSTGWLQTSPA